MDALKIHAEEMTTEQQVCNVEMEGHEPPHQIDIKTQIEETLSINAKLDILKRVNNFIASKFAGKLVTILVEQTEDPLLNVLSVSCDPFYIDQSILHLNIYVRDVLRLEVLTLTPNREIIEKQDVILTENDDQSDLEAILERLQEKKFVACKGFDWQNDTFNTVLQRLRKSELEITLIEKFNGNIIFRSRSCCFSFIPESELTLDQCQNCIEYMQALDNKYLGGVLFMNKSNSLDLLKIDEPNENTILSEEKNDDQEKRKRGRPKGSKNKNYFLNLVGSDDESKIKQENDENDPSNVDNERVLVKTDDPDYIYGNEDVAMEDDPMDTDYSQMKRGFRKRITTKRQKALLETKRKRGRPPIKVGPIDCPDCGKTFETARDYRKHCLEHTNSFACSEGECVKRFKSQKELDIHIRKHRGEKPYVCSDCDKSYTLRQDLRLHMRKHTGERPYLCPSCPKRFARRSALRVHKVSVHEDVKSFLCPECGSAFKANSALIDHRKRVHLQIKPHQCEHCKKDFFSKKDYSEHVRTHTGEKPFQCQLCGRCFGRQNHLKRHVEGVHKNVIGSYANYLVPSSKLIKLESNGEVTKTETSTAIVVPNSMDASDVTGNESISIITGTEAAALGLFPADADANDLETQEIIVENIDLDALQQHFVITSGTSTQVCKLR